MRVKEKEMATHSIFLPGKSPWTESHTVQGVAESDTTEQLTLHTLLGLKVILHGAGDIIPE